MVLPVLKVTETQAYILVQSCLTLVKPLNGVVYSLLFFYLAFYLIDMKT